MAELDVDMPPPLTDEEVESGDLFVHYRMFGRQVLRIRFAKHTGIVVGVLIYAQQ